MVSVHNTINYHNHIYNFPEDTFNINENTIFDYISKQHPDILSNINNNRKLKDVLNSLGVKYTLFISINNDIDNLHDYLFKGSIILDDTDQFILDNLNHKRYEIINKNINDRNILVSNIKCKNGILHIIS
tara:strand:+ start:38 stop:427 length:390 start_codon:yes stop_codon:yes gene_type:complete